MKPNLTSHEVLARLHTIRQILASMHDAVHGLGPGKWRFTPGTDVLAALAEYQQYAERRLHRPEIADYAGDIRAYASFVLCELLAAAR